LIQQLLVESAIIGVAACALGLLFAGVAAPAVIGMLAPPDEPVHLDLRVDWRLLAFAGGLTLVTTALYGLAPALRASGITPITALKTGGRSATRGGLMRPFVAIQVGFSLVVLFVGGLLVLSFARLSSVNPGFATSDVMLVGLETPQRVEAEERRAALLRVLDRLRSVAGVQSVSSAEYNALGRAWTHSIRIPGTQYETLESTMQPVTAGYFETMRIPVVAGRAFTAAETDRPNSPSVIVNQAFATRFFGREAAVGRTLDARFADIDIGRQHEIVGVVGDTRYDLRRPAAPVIYIPMRMSSNGTIHVRISGDPALLAPRLRDEVRAASPLFRVTTVRPQSAVVDQSLLRERLLATLAGFFAAVGLTLAAVGLYGVLSYAVVQRTREIGIRVALGARQVGVVRTVLADAGGAGLVGVACGLAVGLYASRFVETLLFEVSALDFWSLTLPVGVLLLAAALAAALPALRAARVDPVTALRNE
jgi:predicted permease